MAEFKVIYMNHAIEDVYGIIRSQLPEGFESAWVPLSR